MIKLGVFSDKAMGKWFIQAFEPLANQLDITLFITEDNKHAFSQWPLKKHILKKSSERLHSIRHPVHYFKLLKQVNFKSKILFYPFSLKYEFTQNKYDLVVTKSYRSLYTLSELKSHFNYKIIYRYPYALPYVYIFSERTEFIRNTSFNAIDHYWCISNTSQRILKYEGINKPSTVVRNNIDLARFKSTTPSKKLKSQLGIENNERVLLFVGKLTSWKNPFTIISALKLLLLQGIKAKLILIGVGAQKTNLIKASKLTDTNNNIIFTDFIPNENIHRYYKISDIGIMSTVTSITINEQFSFFLIEAMASGLPILATDSGAMREVVGNTDQLYPQGNFEVLSKKIFEILNNKKLYNELSSRSSKRASQLFDNQKNGDILLNMITRTCNQNV